MVEPHRDWCLVARTPIWTGSVRIDNDRERIQNTRLVTTGLLGSIRWWFEVLVRGLGGSACDPSCTECQDRKHCVVCEPFGCTGWARKFRFQVLAENDGDKVQSEPITKDAKFSCRFVPLRDVAPEEWGLLDLTLRLIADYGAIGGKTVIKPSDEPARANQPHHLDYGIVGIASHPDIERTSKATLQGYAGNLKWRAPDQRDFAWASLANLWCVNGRYLARQDANGSTFNLVSGRQQTKSHGQQLQTNDGANRWLAGQQGESKKVFSFKDPPRTFGFVNPGTVDLAQITRRLKQAWLDMDDDEIVTGGAILDNLLRTSASTT